MSDADSVYELLKQAILAKKQVLAEYHQHPREMCPHVLGTKKGVRHCLLYQFGGSSSTSGTSFPPGSPANWRCVQVAELNDVRLREGPWHTESEGPRQTCIDQVDVSVHGFVAQ